MGLVVFVCQPFNVTQYHATPLMLMTKHDSLSKTALYLVPWGALAPEYRNIDVHNMDVKLIPLFYIHLITCNH